MIQAKRKYKDEELDAHARGAQCDGCALRHVGHSFSRNDGTGRNGVLLLGEALGETEALKGLPFQGDAGFLLNKALQRAGLKREDFLITNVVRCHPPNNFLEGASYEAAATEQCDQYFRETLASHPQIKVVVAIGNVPMFKMLGEKGVKNWHGTIHWNAKYGVWVVPTLHPSFVLRTGHKELPTLVYDIGVALRVAKVGFTRSSVDYILYPTHELLEQFADRYEQQCARDTDTLLAADIETAYSRDHDEEDVLEKDGSWTITTISFSYAANTAITVPWRQDYLAAILRLLRGAGTKCWWNGNKFDLPRLRNAGAHIGGLNIDAMDAWHVLRPDLPRGLGYVSPFFTDIAPWKHLSKAEPEYYSCVDADTLLRIMLKIREHMRRDNIWQTFIDYWTRVEPVFAAMSEVGIGIDETKRLHIKENYEKIRDNTATLIQAHIGPELRPRRKAKDGGYHGIPRDVRAYIKEHNLDATAIDAGWRACGYTKFPFIAGTTRVATEAELHATGTEGGMDVEWRYDYSEPFNHNSPTQIIQYLEAKYGREAIPRNKKTGSPTTGAQELERLARKKNDPVLNLILDAANADGKITSFITPWTPDSDGRVHGVFTNTPATPRIASQGPNLQNFPIRSEEAAMMRQMIVPGDGWEYMWELDYKGIEAIIVGILAKDQDYVRLAYKSIHSFVASAAVGKPISLACSDADLDLALKEAKKISLATPVPGSNTTLYDAAKRTVHGSNYLEGARLLTLTFPDVFPTAKDAQRLQDLYFELFPKIHVWQQEVIDFADEHNYVMNPWGIKRWFWNVKRWAYSVRTKKWEQKLGDDAKKAIATNPQGSAGMIMRGALQSNAAAELLAERSLNITIHDSLVGRARDKKHLDLCLERGKAAMEYAIKELGNIVIPVEAKIGPSWGQMKEIKI